jgi:glyoxylase-like metal-dependent hydrolase (beta-lactamase superfamily II)
MSDWTEPGTYEVAPGVHRIPLPLPTDGLRAVNVYAIECDGRLVLVDSGWALDVARTALESALAAIGHGFETVDRFLVTHMHRDHYTMALAVRRLFGARIALGIGERPSIQQAMSGDYGRQLADMSRWGATTLLTKWARERGTPEAIEARSEYEEPDEWLDGTVKVDVGERTLVAVPTPGHTQGHVVFVDEAAGVLYAGDHVLPHITPSIGFEPVRGPLPLGDFLDSLRLMRTYPDLRLLPAHGPVAPSVHARVDELLAHHEERLAHTLDAVRDGAGTAYEAARRLGWTRRQRALDDLDLFNQLLATGETAAHLDVLVSRGQLYVSEPDADGVVGYALSD